MILDKVDIETDLDDGDDEMVSMTVEKQRMKRVRERKARFSMLKAAVGRVSTVLWRTGALPAVARGAAVAGISDSALRELRLVAAVLNGASGKSSSGATALLG